MASACFRFGDFRLDPDDRMLLRGGKPVELNARYLDALALLVREAGRLVSKDRFLEEVWRGVPVTDEALTQCIKTLRRQLGDDASNPRFIETVPKHGYRFIGAVEETGETDEAGQAPAAAEAAVPAPAAAVPPAWQRVLLLGGAGTLGGGVAGLVGGLFYGFGAGSKALQPGMGATSVLLVLVCLTVLLALIGAAGVAFGIASSLFVRRRSAAWAVAGGAFGGMLVGAVVKLLGLDAFTLLFGRSPGDITGAAEGALLGGAVGLGAWLGSRGTGPLSLRQGMAAAGAAGAAAGIAIALSGGRMLGGSLDLLARSFPESRLSLDPIGPLFGESGFGPLSQAATAGLEGLLFGGCVVGAMILARRSLGEEP